MTSLNLKLIENHEEMSWLFCAAYIKPEGAASMSNIIKHMGERERLSLSAFLREREIKFIGLFEDRGHRGPYSPYKPFNHNLYIGIIIFPHIDNPQSTGYN